MWSFCKGRSTVFWAKTLRQRRPCLSEKLTFSVYLGRISICVSTLPTQHATFCVSLWRRAYAQNVRLRFLHRQWTNLFIFRFVFQHCLRSTLHFMFLSDEVRTLETLDFAFYIGSTSTFYISICISTLRLIGADFVSWCTLYTYEGNEMHSWENDAVLLWVNH